MLRKLFNSYQKTTRRKRGEVFRQYFQPTEQHNILDLGGSDGSHIANIIPLRQNVTIADISAKKLKEVVRF